MQDHQRHLYEGEPDDDLIVALEPDQLVVAVNHPVPHRQLSTTVEVGLWTLRVFLLLTSAAVIYAFVMGVVRGGG